MINTVIIDDEPMIIKMVTKIVEDHCPALNVVGTADDLADATQLIENTKPALLLLDIEFPHGTVFSLLEKLRYRNFQVIFITAHNNYATEAFHQNTLDYILKPITPETLVAAINRVEAKIKQHIVSDISRLISSLKSGGEYPRKLPLPSVEGILFVDDGDIIRCEASGRYTILYLNDHRKITVTKILKEIEAMLDPYRFFRIHNSHIINLARIVKYHKREGGIVELSDGSMVEISSSRKEGFMQALMPKPNL